MNWTNKTVVVTGGRRGIGEAMARAFHAAGARVAIADLDGEAADQVGKACGGFGARVDVANETELAGFIDRVEAELGSVDVFVSNAGIGSSDGPDFGAASAQNDAWELSWRVNVMASVYAARRLVPAMIERGGGVFVIVASAAGLLSQLGSTPYTVTKHAAVAFAESLAIAHGDQGLQVACVCPQGVNTDMAKPVMESLSAAGEIIEPDDVARETLRALEDKQFLVLPHVVVRDYVALRASDPDRFLGGMRKIRRGLMEKNGRPY